MCTAVCVSWKGEKMMTIMLLLLFLVQAPEHKINWVTPRGDLWATSERRPAVVLQHGLRVQNLMPLGSAGQFFVFVCLFSFVFGSEKNWVILNDPDC